MWRGEWRRIQCFIIYTFQIAENYNIFDFELSDEDMQKISEIDQQRRYENW